MEKTDKDDDRIAYRDMYREFTIWYGNNKSRKNIPTDREFSRQINLPFKPTRINGRCKQGIEGYKFFEDNYDE